MIKSISFDEEEILSSILRLHCKGKDIDLDPTYSIGKFYRKDIKEPKYKFDLSAKRIPRANAEDLPLKDSSMEVIIFDPPFLATKGKSLEIENQSNKINKRFGTYPDEKSLFRFYDRALGELYRVCKKKGILIFKCQDKVSSGKQYFSHCLIFNMAIEKGWYPKDLFVLLAKNRIIADWQKKNQKHARKFHAYYWVFQKEK